MIQVERAQRTADGDNLGALLDRRGKNLIGAIGNDLGPINRLVCTAALGLVGEVNRGSAENGHQLVEQHRRLDVIEGDGVRAHQQATVVAGDAQILERLDDLRGNGLQSVFLLAQHFQNVQDVDVAVVGNLLFVHERIHAFAHRRFRANALVGALECVVAHRARRHDPRRVGFLDTDQVANRRELTHDIVLRQCEDGTTAIPVIEFFDLGSEVPHREQQRRLEIRCVILHRTTGVVAELHAGSAAA